ncbi:hypothetical protein [Spiroplasma apis]|uniref:Uncharacterized protein n=1 Tax=Spiroplasma apis B31 TaxID=1276258 RepID=V5RII7_SPIAP|nr:hypothetical protein [Spiroplasma apis]AHB36293.1 hypothetical protein SAPIS_v1c04480 [Spiroplasma apis B31]
MKKKIIRSRYLLPITLSGVLTIPLFSSVSLIKQYMDSNNNKNLNSLSNLLDFKDIPLEPSYRSSLESLAESSNKYSAAYDWNYKVILNNNMIKVIDGDMNFLNADFKAKKPITVKSELTDAIYLGLQVMGHNAPAASELNEIGRYEISNFHALEKKGYSVYLNKVDNNELLEILNIDQEKTYEYEGKTYFKLDNLNETDNIYFKSNSNVVNKETIEKWNGQVVPINLIAVNEEEPKDVLTVYDPNYHRKTVNISILNHISNEFIQYKLWDWNQYNSNEENLQCYIANNLIKIYIEIALSYINFIDPKSNMYNVKAPPLEGIQNVFSHKEGGGGGATPGSLLYYAYKYNSYYDLRIFLFKYDDADSRYIYISYDQNNWIEFEKDINGKDPVIVDEIKNTNNNIENRTKLSFNPWVELNQQIKDFVKKTWNLLLFAMEKMS